VFINAAIEGVEEGTQHLAWLLEIQLPQHKHASHDLIKAEATAVLTEEQASAVDGAHSDSELHTTPKQPNKKRKADALSNEEVDLTAEEISPKRRRPSKLVRRRAHGGRPAERANLKAKSVHADIEDIGRARRRPTAGVAKFQRYPALRLT
jgi:hypothetical protein